MRLPVFLCCCLCICSEFITAKNPIEWAGMVEGDPSNETENVSLRNSTNTTGSVTEAPSDPRFMMGMLNGKEKNWSFKRPGLFGTHNVDIKIGAKESLFCRLSKRQSVVMFSFCMQNKGQNQGWGKSTTASSNSGWGQSSTTPSSSQGWGEESGNGGQKKGGGKKKGKNKKGKGKGSKGQSQGDGWGQRQQDQQQKEWDQQDQMQDEYDKNEKDDESEIDTELKVQINSPMDYPEVEEMVQNADDVETKTEASSSLSSSEISRVGKPKIVVRSETSIAALYEFDLDQWNKQNMNGQVKKKLQNLKAPAPGDVIQKHYFKTGDPNFDIQNLRHLPSRFARGINQN